MKKRNHILFFVLFFYILLQSIWWLYNIYQLSIASDPNTNSANKLNMVMGEGIVFCVILVIGFFLTHRSMQKEIEVSKQQQNFLLSITHELKTPIASLKLYLQTLLKHNLDEDKKRDIIGKSIHNTERLNELVENILLATKIDDKAFPVNITDIALSELMEDHILKLVEGSGKNIGIEFFIQPNVIFKGDQEATISIITNLVSNAIKYAPEQTSICATLVQKGGEIAFSIADEGKGIPDNEKEKIFQKFYRIGNEETRNTKGTGLGLFIVKHLVEAQNGMIQIKNNKPKGSIFVVSFRA